MRLRSLRRLEEMEIRKEHKALTKELKDLQSLLSNDRQRWKRIAEDIAKTREAFGKPPLGTRRTILGKPPTAMVVSTEAFVEREAITAILSDKGWVRAVRGGVANPDDLKFKEGDKLRLLVPCETTDRLCLFATNGRAYTIRAADLPRGRGDGQPVRLLADMTNEDDVAALFVWRSGIKYLVASTTGRGFVVASDDLVAEKRTGKQVLNLKPGEEAKLCLPAEGDHVAIVGENRKLLVFPLAQVPELARGAGVILQRYADGGLSDAQVFALAHGLSWKLGDKVRTETNLRDWLGERAQAGRLPPNGFPRSNRFG
jgi:topoisomerase-4 subunit A